uniref:Reverse transcriptase domain-containing protein n=1 Tax=Tanacetum cinerariifolium TaxID=118510 RepID=A0A6L2NG32_TANCI|nr:reverse transcriptase domain-containing protein [Tanacetum cinerariifolium]
MKAYENGQNAVVDGGNGRGEHGGGEGGNVVTGNGHGRGGREDGNTGEGENLNTEAPGTGRTPSEGTSVLAGPVQGQEKVTPRKLFNEKSGGAGSENSQMSPSAEEVRGYSFDGSSRSRSRGRSKSKSVKSKPQSVRATFEGSQAQSQDPKNVDGFEKLSNKFLEEFSQQKRYDKDPTKIHGIKRKPNEGLQVFMDRFKAKSAHIKGMPLVLRISAFMHRHSHPELAKKLNDKILKIDDEMWEKVRAFIKGETAADTIEVIRYPRQSGQKSKGSAKGKEKVINMVRSQGYQKRPYEKASSLEGYMLMVVSLQRLCTSIVLEILTIGRCSVVKSSSPYNALLGRTRIRSLGVVASTIHLMVKFPTSNGVATIATTRETLREGHNGISWAITVHSLDTYPHIKPKVQKKRSLASDRRKVYKCFLDAYKGYHKIRMTKKDEENTAFHTEEGLFCDTKMPFGLKNVRSTYQRLVDSAFNE